MMAKEEFIKDYIENYWAYLLEADNRDNVIYWYGVLMGHIDMLLAFYHDDETYDEYVAKLEKKVNDILERMGR